MIPQFPELKKLELKDKSEIDYKTSGHEPYSDFNFVSLWCYNVLDEISVSILNDNLVVKFTDYITKKPFFSFAGDKCIDSTIETLLEFSGSEGLAKELKLVPEYSIHRNPEVSKIYTIKDDQDNHDYILSVQSLSKLRSKKLRAKKNFVNRFQKKHIYIEQILDLNKKTTQKDINGLFDLWVEKKGLSKDETLIERTALERIYHVARYNNSLYPIGIYINDKLVGFSINELERNGYAMIHFEKADTCYDGIFQYLMHLNAKSIEKLGYTHINYEQDLGIEGLRKAKKSYQPVKLLKKYTISLEN